MDTLYGQIKVIINQSLCRNEVREHWLKRVEEGKLTRDENKVSHFCVYFLPYNPVTKKLFIIHHKKSGLWLSPGGHIDDGEKLEQTLDREVNEELGIRGGVKNKAEIFLLTVTPINNAVQPCKEHLDIWYRFPTDGSEFSVDPREFHEVRWLTIPEARQLITDPPNVEALDKTGQLFAK